MALSRNKGQAPIISLLLFLVSWRAFSFQSSRIINLSRPRCPFSSPVITFGTSTPDTEQDTVSHETKKASTTRESKEENLSEMDARVLKSMLQDTEKLDLKTEESLKKLLERGVVSKKVPNVNTEKKKDDRYADSEFSSEALRKLSDTKLWRSLSRKAGDWLESAKLYVANRAERDALTLAALGAFAWERAARDVARALPAGGNSTQTIRKNIPKKKFLLSEKSSVEEMATPIDELKSVGSAVADILRSGGTDGGSPFSVTRTTSTGLLRSAARSRQDRRNFQRAYQRSQEQKSNPFKVTKQATAGVVDTAWELRRELQAEANRPGYRTKEVQNALGAASDSTRQLLEGAQETWRLGRAKQKGRKLLKEQGATEAKLESKDTAFVPPGDFIDADGIFFATTVPTKEGRDDVAQTEMKKETRVHDARKHAESHRVEQQRQEQLRMQKLRADKQAQRALQLKQHEQDLLKMYSELESECCQLREQLQRCIVSPEETWLRSEVIDGVREFDQALIRQVVTEMIETRNSLKGILANQSEGQVEVQVKTQQLLNELLRVKSKMDEIEGHAQQAVSLGASQALKEKLTERSGKAGDNLIPVILRLDEIKHQVDGLIASEQESEYSPVGNEPHWSENMCVDSAGVSEDGQGSSRMQHGAEALEEDYEFTSQFAGRSISEEAAPKSREAEIVDVIPEAFMYAVATMPTTPSSTKTEVETDKSPTEVVASMAELVTDDDFDVAVGEYKRVEVVEDDDETLVDSEKQEANMVFTILLRSLDIIFFLLEKSFTVAIPTVVSSSLTAKARMDNIAQGGLGSKGWKPIGSAQAGARRY